MTIFGWRVIGFDGFKTPGEFALFDRATRSAITGDAFWGVPAGALQLDARREARRPGARGALGAQAARAAGVEHLLVGDGMPIYHRASEALLAMLDARRDVLTRRVNLDELEFRVEDGPGAVYGFGRGSRLADRRASGWATRSARSSAARCIARLTGTRAKKKCSSCGRARRRCARRRAIRAAARRRGRVSDRRRGRSQIWNDSDAPCTVLMFANIDAGDVCVYPDSKKLLVESIGHDRAQRTPTRLLRRRSIMRARARGARGRLRARACRAARRRKRAAPKLPRPAHTVVVIEENKTLAQIVGSARCAVSHDGRAQRRALHARATASSTRASRTTSRSSPADQHERRSLPGHRHSRGRAESRQRVARKRTTRSPPTPKRCRRRASSAAAAGTYGAEARAVDALHQHPAVAAPPARRSDVVRRTRRR